VGHRRSKRNNELTVTLPAGMTEPSSTLGWHGYRVVGVLFMAVPTAASLAWWFAETHSGPLLRDALTAALVPVGFIIAFGFGYAGNTFSKRLALFGYERETHPAILVLLFFGLAVGTVALILVYLALGDRDNLCLGPCLLAVPLPWIDASWQPLLVAHSTIGQLAAAGVGMVLAGSVQVLFGLLHPRRLDVYSHNLLLGRRFAARLLDSLVLLASTFCMIEYGPELLVGRFGLSWTAARVTLTCLLLVLPFLYEVTPQFGWKWWLGLRLVAPPDGRPVAIGRLAVRALVTSLVFSLGIDAAVVLWTIEGSYLFWVMVGRMLLLVALIPAVVHPHGQGFHDALLGTQVRGDLDGGTEPGQSSESEGLRLRSADFTADEDDPFANDLLDRRPQVEYLSAVITATDSPLVVMVDAPWGSGKTAFLRMCAAHLRHQGVTVAEFNAWADQHTQQPLLDMVGALSARLPKGAATRIGSAASGLLTLLTTDHPIPRIDSWDDHNRAVRSFTESLAEVAADRGRLVVIVDELDRCQPQYTLGILADIHHLFSVDGVTVLLGVNRRQLCHAVQAVYGPSFDADSYLRRFADIPINLPSPNRTELEAFLDHLYAESRLHGRTSRGLAKWAATRAVLRLVIELKSCSLRDLQQAAHIYALALIKRVPDDHPYDVWQLSVAAMVVLRVADRDAYDRFVAGQSDSFEALTSAYAALGPEPHLRRTDTLPHGTRRDHFAAALINIGSRDDWCDTISGADDAFVERYRHAHTALPKSIEGSPRDSRKAARDVLKILCHIRSCYQPLPVWHTLEADKLANLIDLAVDLQ